MRKFLQIFMITIGSCLSACADQKAEQVVQEVSGSLPEISVGEDSAPVTMIQYSAFSCSHCADFHNKVVPLIEEKYVKSGQVKLVFRDFPVDNPSLRACQVAWCGGADNYLKMMPLIFSSQKEWLFADDPLGELKQLALTHGLDEEQFNACIHDGELMDKIIMVRKEGQEQFEINATPTLIINDQVVPYAMTFDEFEEAVKPILGE